MKIYDRPVRIMDAETMEIIDSKEGGKVASTSNPIETLWGTRQKLLALVVMILTFVVVGLAIRDVKAENNTLRAEIAEYQMLFEDNECINVLALAGKYATSKTRVPVKDSVYKVIVQSGAWYPEIIMAQYIIESGSGTSSVSKNALNFFGMKKISEGPQARPSLQIRGMDWHGYGMYMNWQHSILDRVLWDFWMFDGKNPGSENEYLNKINGIYAEDPAYISKLRLTASEWRCKTELYRLPTVDTSSRHKGTR